MVRAAGKCPAAQQPGRGDRACFAGALDAFWRAQNERPRSLALSMDEAEPSKIAYCRGLMEIRRRVVPETAAALVAAGIEPLIARIYASRGIVSADELDHALTRLPSWHTLKGIDSAVARLSAAIANREQVLIVA